MGFWPTEMKNRKINRVNRKNISLFRSCLQLCSNRVCRQSVYCGLFFPWQRIQGPVGLPGSFTGHLKCPDSYSVFKMVSGISPQYELVNLSSLKTMLNIIRMVIGLTRCSFINTLNLFFFLKIITFMKICVFR